MPQNPAVPKDPVAAAAAALAGARQKFPASMAKSAGVVGQAPARMTSAPTPVKKESLPAGAGADVPAGIKWNQDQAGAAKDVMPKTPIVKYARGGKIKKDGVQVVDAEKGETVLPVKNKKLAEDLSAKHLDGMAEGLKDKSEARHGKIKKVHVHVNDDKTFAMKHEHHPLEDGTSVPDTTHTAPDMDGLLGHVQKHLGDPAAAAPAAAVPAAAPVAAAAAPAAAPDAAEEAAEGEGSGNSPTHTSTETGGSSPGGASTGGVGSGMGGAGTGGAATGGASTSTGGASTGGAVTVTISGSSSTETSTSTGSKSAKGKSPKGAGGPINITINSGASSGPASAASAEVQSGDGPGAVGTGGSGEGSGGGGGGGGGRGTPSHPEAPADAVSPGVK